MKRKPNTQTTPLAAGAIFWLGQSEFNTAIPMAIGQSGKRRSKEQRKHLKTQQPLRENKVKNEYDPNKLIDFLRAELKCGTDSALASKLEVAPPIISKVRHRKLPIGAGLLIRMHEETEISIHDLRNLMGDRRKKFRMGEGVKKGAKKSQEKLAA